MLATSRDRTEYTIVANDDVLALRQPLFNSLVPCFVTLRHKTQIAEVRGEIAKAALNVYPCTGCSENSFDNQMTTRLHPKR